MFYLHFFIWFSFFVRCKADFENTEFGGQTKALKFEIPEFSDVLVDATADVINNFFAKRSPVINIFRESSDPQRHIFDSGFINDVFYRVRGNVQIESEDHDILDNHKSLSECDEVTQVCQNRHQIRTFNIFFVSNYETFYQIYEKMNPEEFHYPGYYLIVLTKFKKNFGDDVSSILSDCWSQNIINVNILLHPDEMNNEAQMLTYNPFQSNSCGKSRYYLLNIYKDKSFAWDNGYYPDKDQNMHKCPVKVAVFETPPYMLLYELGDGTYYPDGVDGIVLRLLSQRMNFTIDFVVPEDGKGAILSNGTLTGAIKSVVEEDSEFTIGYFSKSANGRSKMADSYYYATSKQIWLVPPKRPFSSLERLLKPFTIVLWVGTSFILIFSFLTVFILKFSSNSCKNFVYGKGISYPGLNIINITFGGSLPRTPNRNFARFIMMVFTTGYLVLRNAYQGALFNFITSNNTNVEVETLNDMFERNFTFYVMDISKYFIEHIPSVAER